MAINKRNIKYWLVLIGLSSFLGIKTAEIYVFMPDWWADLVKFWF